MRFRHVNVRKSSHALTLTVVGAQLEMPAGSISVHHTRTLHGSTLNTSEEPRRMLFFQYAAVDAWPLGGERPLLPSSLTIWLSETRCCCARDRSDAEASLATWT